MSDGKTVFHALDRDADIEISQGNLPHWFQADAAIFITFRTADSLPREVVLRWHHELKEWLDANKLPAELADGVLNSHGNMPSKLATTLTEKQYREFKRQRERIFNRSLDECHGECLLRNPVLARIVGDAILRFAGERYDLDSFVVMPNHVHAIVQFRSGFDLKTVSQSWMRYTSRAINQHLSRNGVFWQPEPFDHIIRSSEQFRYLGAYIEANPRKAKLRNGEYLYWKHE